MAPTMTVHVVFGEVNGSRRPIGLVKHRRRSGPRVSLAVDRSATGTVYVLHHLDLFELVVAASSSYEQLEAVRARLGPSARRYDIVAVPLLDRASR